MSRQGKTKDLIVKLISRGNNTLSGISEELHLAPSTVSKHIEDLIASGAIFQTNNPHIKKWKYYEVSPTVHGANKPKAGIATMKSKYFALAIICLLSLSALAYLYSSLNSTDYVMISLTDPPQVPFGTQALYINYSSLSVQVGGAGQSLWIPANASGRIDLLSLVNASQIIGGAEIPSNLRIEAVKFNISSSSITIDNSSFPVVVPNNIVLASIENRGSVNSSSAVLLDFSPIVAARYIGNTTQFTMLPTLRALTGEIPLYIDQGRVHSDLQTKYLGWRISTPPSFSWPFGGAQNLTILGKSLVSAGNLTTFTITLRNSGPQNLTVGGIILFANQSAMVFASQENGTLPGNSTLAHGLAIPAGPMPGVFPIVIDNSGAAVLNGSQIGAARVVGGGIVRIALPREVNAITISGAWPVGGSSMPIIFRALPFRVNQNGTLSLSAMPEEMVHSSGYKVPSGSTVTFEYVGNMTIGKVAFPIGRLEASGYSAVAVTNLGVVR